MWTIDKIEQRSIDERIKYELEEFKSVHAHFIDILVKMHAGDIIDSRTILELERKQDNLVDDIIKQSSPNMITGETVGIMTKEQLEQFKKIHGRDKFIEVDDKDVKTMDKNSLKLLGQESEINPKPNIIKGEKVKVMTKDQLEMFMRNHVGDTIIKTDDNSVKVMNTKQLELFKNNDPYNHLLNSLTDNQNIARFKKTRQTSLQS
eukprot:TRINITY_DN14713_c0_g1_i1.p1 TRINITY_DN14713_c0_g1~~TRINITY_DN14713_c0_g1_i1.p1  ORF type:complete len:205 (-),score=44.41 TRINITY_DN14713_c0_g1_i1:590-1204(-)